MKKIIIKIKNNKNKSILKYEYYKCINTIDDFSISTNKRIKNIMKKFK